jgi:hypothetical protein
LRWVDPTLNLLVLHQGAKSYAGFPAVCMAIAQRNTFARWIALLLMPIAVGLEAIRLSFAFKPEVV